MHLEVLEKGRPINKHEPSSSINNVLATEAGLNGAPSLLTDGTAVHPNSKSVCVEVLINGVDGTSDKDVRLHVLSRGGQRWFSIPAMTVLDLQTQAGAMHFFILADAWIYERVYVEVLQNDGSGTVSAFIVQR